MNLNRNRALILVIASVFVLSFLSLAFWKLKLSPIGYINQLFGKSNPGSSAFGKLKESSESSNTIAQSVQDSIPVVTVVTVPGDLTSAQAAAIKEANYNLIGDYSIGKTLTLSSSSGTTWEYISGFIVKAVSPTDSKIRFLDKAGTGHDYNVKFLSYPSYPNYPSDSTFSVLESSSVDDVNDFMASNQNIINFSDLISKSYIRVNDQIIFGVLLRDDEAPSTFAGFVSPKDLPLLQQLMGALEGKGAFPKAPDAFVIPVNFEVIVPAR